VKPVNAVGSMTAFSKVPVPRQSPPGNSPERLRPQSSSRQADQSKEAAKGTLDRSIVRLNRTTYLFNRKIKFETPSGSKDVIVKIVDQETGEVIRQIPPAEFIRLRERIKKVAGRMLRARI